MLQNTSFVPTKVLLITPPFTQLNTPYPATAYLSGFLKTRGIPVSQADLGIEVTLSMFSKKGLLKLFTYFDKNGLGKLELSENAHRIYHLRNAYMDTINAVIAFLQGRQPTLAPLIASGGFLPQASRFTDKNDLSWAFGAMGVQDKAKHLATMYLEDLSDWTRECIDPFFGFTRYAERLGRSASSFDELYTRLNDEITYIDGITLELLAEKIDAEQPGIVGFSVPFPGNLYAALRCAQFIKNNYPEIKTSLGGGFVNTELRSLNEPRVFEFFDFVSLDDGEAVLERIVQFTGGNSLQEEMIRTFVLRNGEVSYMNHQGSCDYRQSDIGTPDYTGLPLDQYICAIEIANPMHSLWSDGRWNKLTMAHGCYWGKCTFCDITLDYISRYEPNSASQLCDRIETLIAQTGHTGFHFVDEAAPPSLMKALALEIIRRKLVISWWTNIRFEKSFSRDLCLLLRESGCIAVSGGLEVAGNRLLALIQKGVTVEQVIAVNKNFVSSGIMVHAYLMYGFPTQTDQETIDSLEIVRQMFQAGILQSAFWHLYTMTTHSPTGKQPGQFGVTISNNKPGSFANNDLVHLDPKGTDHEAYSEGLKKALFNYMHHTCLDQPLHKWFDFRTPKTSVLPGFVAGILEEHTVLAYNPQSRLVWSGTVGKTEVVTKSKKGNQWEVAEITLHGKKDQIVVRLDKEKGTWLQKILLELQADPTHSITMSALKKAYGDEGWDDFELFWDNKPVNTLYQVGLLVV